SIMPFLTASNWLSEHIANVWLLWTASIFFIVGYSILKLRAPSFIQEYQFYSQYESRGHSHRCHCTPDCDGACARASRQYPRTCSRYPPLVNPRTLTVVHPNCAITAARRRQAPGPRFRCGISKMSKTVCVVMRSMPSSPIFTVQPIGGATGF